MRLPELIRVIDRRVQRALRRVRIGGVRGVISRVEALDAGQKLKAAVTGLVGPNDTEQTRPARVVQHYGLASYPKADAEAVVLPIAGRTASGVIIGTEDPQYRPVLSEGEVVLYDHLGQAVQLNDDGTIDVAATGDLRLNNGATAVAADGDSCVHSLTAGPYTVTGSITVRSIRNVKVPS